MTERLNRRRYLSLATLAVAGLAGCSGDDGSPDADAESTPADDGGDGGGDGGDDGGNDGGNDGQSDGDPSTPQSRAESVRVGEVASGENLSMVVEGVSRTTTIGEFQEAESGNEYVLVTLAVKNTTEGEFLNFSGFLQTALTDDDDYSYDQTVAVTDNSFDGGQLAPGEVSRGDVVFEVPEDAAGLAMQFDFEAFAFTQLDRVTVDLSQQADAAATLEQTLRVPVNGLGESVTFGDVTVTANDVSFAEQLGQFAQADEGNEYVVVDITTENGTDEEQSISTLLQMLVKDGAGNSYDMDLGAQSSIDRAYNEGQPLAAGETRRGRVAYEVPQGASPLYWIFEFTLWTEGDKTFWQLR